MDISVINSIQDQFNKNEATYLSSSLYHRKSALDFALLHNFPGRKDEEYKYTPIDRILKKNFGFEKIITSKTTALHFEDHFYKLKGNHLVFLNGNYLPLNHFVHSSSVLPLELVTPSLSSICFEILAAISVLTTDDVKKSKNSPSGETRYCTAEWSTK